MELKIWRYFIIILNYRKDLNEIIKPFMENLINKNEKYSIHDEKYKPFLKSLSKYDIKLLYNHKIINDEEYSTIRSKKPSTKLFSPQLQEIEEILKGDKIGELQKLIMDQGINNISPNIKPFNEISKMKIPIIIDSIIHNASKCFNYLLINEIEDPKKTMEDLNSSKKIYQWDCMTVAIYYGRVEIMKILEEEKGIEKWTAPMHLEAAILSYRNSLVKQLINKIQDQAYLNTGLWASIRSNNIKELELMLSKGAYINSKDIIYQIIQILFLIKII